MVLESDQPDIVSIGPPDGIHISDDDLLGLPLMTADAIAEAGRSLADAVANAGRVIEPLRKHRR